MLDRLILGLGAASSAAGVALQGVSLGGSTGFKVQVAAIVCTSIGAGCLAMSRSVLGGSKPDNGK